MNLSLKTEEVKELSKAQCFEIIQLYILEQRELSVRKTKDEDSFNRAAWSEYQAFQLGIQKALDKLSSFIPNQEGNEID